MKNNNLFNLANKKNENEDLLQQLSISNFKKSWQFFRKKKLAMFCVCFIIFLLLAVIFIPMFYPYSYLKSVNTDMFNSDLTYNFLPPFKYSLTEQNKIANNIFIWPHFFGTDGNGIDYFIRVIYGIRVSLFISLLTTFTITFIGIIYGAISGLNGGKVDLIMMRIVDTIYSLPEMIIFILFGIIFDRINKHYEIIKNNAFSSIFSIFIVFILFFWAGTARLIRGQILSLKQQDYVLASKSMGAKNSFIILKHLIPNCISIIIVNITQQIPNSIFNESYLSYLGLGVKYPIPSLGNLIFEGSTFLNCYPRMILIPSFFLCAIVLSFNIIGSCLRDAIDPKQISFME